MTDLPTKEVKSSTEIALDIIRRKNLNQKEAKDIARLEAIYSSEIKELETKLHKTTGGTIMTVSDMDNDHLFNTIKGHINRRYGSLDGVHKKYLDEAKSRPGMIDRILGIESTLEVEYEDDELDFRF